jgi:hypothetical protein
MSVKPLVWSAPTKPDKTCSYDHCSAATPWGVYRIKWKSWKDYPSYIVDTPNGEVLVHGDDSLDEAKRVAQRDFEVKILACLA